MKPQFGNRFAVGGSSMRLENVSLLHSLLLLAMDRARGLVLMASLLTCTTGNAAFTGTEFAGHVSGADSSFNLRRGAVVKGYFVYDPQGGRLQSASQGAIFMFEIPEHRFRVERTSFNLGVLNNFMDWMGVPYLDIFMLEFTYPGGYASFSLSSSNLALFANNQLPATVPPMSAFDAGGTIYVTIDQVQPYQTLRVEITELKAFPGSLTANPGIVDVRRTGGTTTFRFLTRPSTGYAIEASDGLTGNWATMTNVAPTLEPIVVIHDAEPGLGKRFYRIRTGVN